MKKIITGIGVGAIMLIVGMAMGQVFDLLASSLKTEYQNPDLFRPWSDPIMSLYFAVPFLTGLILVYVWDAAKKIVKGGDQTIRGLRFGFIYWIITIPGMIMSYSSFTLSLMMVTSWTISNLFQALCAGLLFSKLRP